MSSGEKMQTAKDRVISATCVQCSPETLEPYREQIILISKLAYVAVPTSEILERLARYHSVILFLDGPKLVGFMFMTEHKTKEFYFIGIRFTAILPEYQKHKVSQIVFPTYLTYLLKTLFKKIASLDRREIVFFCRACNPYAYAAIHAMGNFRGGVVQPDLIRESRLKLRATSAKAYLSLRDEVGLSGLDIETGVIKDGSKNSGIIPPEGSPSRMKFWKTSWNDYANAGDEVVITVPMGPVAVVGWLALAVKRSAFGIFGRQKIK
jgi:hypothetical protein